MRFGDERESGNFIDDTGRGGGGFGLGGGGGNMLGCLLPMIASRFGIGGIVVLVIGYFLLSSLGGGSLGGLGGGAPSTQQVGTTSSRVNLDPHNISPCRFSPRPRTPGRSFCSPRTSITPTPLVSYSESDQSGCGAAQSAMGPFYCPDDKRIYLDTEFFTELAQRFQAPGRFRHGLCHRA